MARKTKNPIAAAKAMATSATNMFALAKAELDEANDLLDTTIETDRSQIDELNQRITTATQWRSNNARVIRHLDEMLPAGD